MVRIIWITIGAIWSLSLVSKVTPKSRILAYDSWTVEDKDKYKMALDNLKSSVSAARRAAATTAVTGDSVVFSDFLRTATMLDLTQESVVKVTTGNNTMDVNQIYSSPINELCIRGKQFRKETIQKICNGNAHVLSHLDDNKSDVFF